MVCSLRKLEAGALTYRLRVANVVDNKLDVSAAYPTNGTVFNVSKATTFREMCRIEGVNLHTQYMQSINLSGGHVNAVEIAEGFFKLPGLQEWLEAFRADQQHSDAA